MVSCKSWRVSCPLSLLASVKCLYLPHIAYGLLAHIGGSRTFRSLAIFTFQMESSTAPSRRLK